MPHMATPTTSSTTPSTQPYAAVTAVSNLYRRHDGPDSSYPVLAAIVEAAHAAHEAYEIIEEAEFQARRRTGRYPEPVLTEARKAAESLWQFIEHEGLPLIQQWQRDCLGYSEEEVSR